jgi:ketosteroid isomerase-like protein
MRVGTLVTITHPDGFPTVIFYVLEQQADGRWLIDEEIFVQ